MDLILSLNDDFSATRQLYWDEGDSIDPIENGKYTLVNFEFGNLVLTSNVEVSEIIDEYHKNEKKTYPLRFTHFEINSEMMFTKESFLAGSSSRTTQIRNFEIRINVY